MMADSDILQDDYLGELEIDADEEDALLENRHSIFLDKDGSKVDRYNFDDEEEEDILDIGVSEDLALIESEHLSDYSVVVEKSSQRQSPAASSALVKVNKVSLLRRQFEQIVEPKKPSQTIVSTVSSSATSDASISENLPSSTSGVEEISATTEKAKGAKKIVISNAKSSGSGPAARQIFTKDFRNRRGNSNIRNRLGGQLRQGNVRMRHPHPRMMGPPPFRHQGPHMRVPGPPRQGPPRPMGPPSPQQRSPGPWPRKILINPHFNQNQQNRNQPWERNQNQPPPRFQPPQQQPPPRFQPPQQPQWQQPPNRQHQPPPHQQPHQLPPPPSHQQGPQPRFRHAPPPQEYDQRREQYPPPSPVMTPEPQQFYQQNYRPEYEPYQEAPSQAPPMVSPQPPHAYGPSPTAQTPPMHPAPYQQNYQPNYQQYPDSRPPPQQSYDMQPLPSGSPYDAPRPMQPSHGMGPMDMDVRPPQSTHGYMEQPPVHQNYPPPQPHYAAETPLNQYAPPPRPYEDQTHNQFNPSRPPPPDNSQFHSDYNRPQVIQNPALARDREYLGDPNQDYAFGQGAPHYEEHYPPANTADPGYQPELRQPQTSFQQFEPMDEGFGQAERPPLQSPRGNIKSRLGARVPVSPQGSKVPPRQSPQEGGAQFGGMKSRRNLDAAPLAPKQPRFESSKVSRNILQVQTIPNLPDTTSSEREAVENDDEDDEMREYRKKIEAQKQFREKIFQIKEARRKQAVLQQGKSPNKSGETSTTAKKPVQTRSIQPIATIVGAGAGKRPMPGGSTNVLAKRKAQGRGKARGGPAPWKEIVDVNKPLKQFNVSMKRGRIMIQSKVGESRAVIFPDTTQGQRQQPSKTGSSEPAKSATQPRTLDERFSGLKSGVLVQPNEERFTSSSNRTVLPATGSAPLDPNASNIVIIDNLSASTKAQQLVEIASQCGKLAELNLKQSQKQAILKFKTAVGAAEFFKKYQRKMVDLSMITLTMG